MLLPAEQSLVRGKISPHFQLPKFKGNWKTTSILRFMEDDLNFKIQPEYNKLCQIKEKVMDDQTQDSKMIKTEVWQNSVASLSQEKLQQKREDDKTYSDKEEKEEKDVNDDETEPDLVQEVSVGASNECGVAGSVLFLILFTRI